MIYLLTAIGLSHGGRSTVHIYTQTIHITIKKQKIHRATQQFWKSASRAPSWLVIPTLAFALQPRKKHWKTSIRVAASKNNYLRQYNRTHPFPKFKTRLSQFHSNVTVLVN